jgi:L-ascorbate metabolism protein UlaG (beta-lactamase superfamily)
VLLQVGGLNILTDPIFSERASPLSWVGPKRKTPPALRVDELPHIDIVIVSHNHYDHLDLPTLRALQAQPGGPPLLLMPLGVGDWLKRQGIGNVQQLDWWQSHPVGEARLHFVPVQHWSARGLFDRFETLWGGWVIESQADGKPFKAFFTGDTGYSKDFIDIQRRFGDFDFAMIPVGAYEPRWFMKSQHVNPAEAVQIHRDLQARQSLGIHWGAFELTDESLDEPATALKSAVHEAGIDPEAFFVTPLGQTRRIGR